MTDLTGRVALLTGASGGIGTAIARRLADEGVDLCLSYGRHGEDAEAVGAYARERGRRVTVTSADLSDSQAPAALVRTAERELGAVDLLIANAGTADIRGWQNIDLESWNATLAVNLTAPFLLAQQVLPGMVARGFGRICSSRRSPRSPVAWWAPTTRRARPACTDSCTTLRRGSQATASP